MQSQNNFERDKVESEKLDRKKNTTIIYLQGIIYDAN